MSSNILTLRKLSQNGTQTSILQTVRDFTSISRSGIVQKTHLPHAATSRAVAALLQNNTVIETKLADTSGPRRKRGISLNPEKGFCIAVEYSAIGLEAIALNTAYQKIAENKASIDLKNLPQNEKILKIISFLEKFKNSISLSDEKCLGIAIVDPGIIDTDQRISIYCSTLENWENVPLANLIEMKFAIPVTLINTSMAKIRALDRLEIQGSHDNLMYIEYGNGIGCGLKLAGNYISGQNNLAGELGHIRVTDKPVCCRCGGIGCLEAVAALPALKNHAISIINESTDSVLNKKNKISGLAVLEATAYGDRLASHIIDEAFDYLARAVAAIANVVNPEIIVFDWLIGTAGNQAVSTLMRSLQKNILSTHWNNTKICISKIDSFIGPLGGAANIIDKALEH
ncbi:MAG: ROK family protein [Sedimentisphaerales bacterium]|nr:ROK family protein [Sedimentisphaerales bacterium]